MVKLFMILFLSFTILILYFSNYCIYLFKYNEKKQITPLDSLYLLNPKCQVLLFMLYLCAFTFKSHKNMNSKKLMLISEFKLLYFLLLATYTCSSLGSNYSISF